MTEQNGTDTSTPTGQEAKIIKQIEYYFGDINLARDKFLQHEIKEDDGWVPLETMIKFNRLKILSDDLKVIADAMKKSGSGLMEVSEDGQKIRRSTSKPLPEFDQGRRDDLKLRTVYSKGFPKDASLDQLLEFFNKPGKTEHVQMRRDTHKKFKGSCFVIYGNADSAKAFMASDEKYREEDEPVIRLYKEDYFKKKTEERKKGKEDELKNREEREKERDEHEKQKFCDRITKGAILDMKNIPADVTREKLKKIFEDYGTIAWADFNKGEPQGQLRFDSEGGAKVALEKALEAGEGKIKVDDAELECKVLEGEAELDHWKDIFRAQKEVREKKMKSRHKGKRGYKKAFNPRDRRRGSGGKSREDSGESGDEGENEPSEEKKVKLEEPTDSKAQGDVAEKSSSDKRPLETKSEDTEAPAAKKLKEETTAE